MGTEVKLYMVYCTLLY